MAFLGSNMPTEAGLRLLLVPLNSNIVIRTACCTVGVALPVYSTFKAIEAKDPNEQHKWLLYWAVYGSFSVGEIFADRFISWFPLYYHMKLAFLAWLQLPTTNGAKQLYMNHLRPLLSRHQAKLDQIVGLFYNEAGKFVSAHQGEFQFMKTIMMKFLMSVKQLVNGSSQPVATQERRAIVGPRQQVETSDSTDDNHDDDDDNDNDDDDDEYVSVSAAS
ncbi:HVA22-like protein k [Lactuca sativa]|nr:HVA22-like protein k [Lactuca sativa]